MVHCDRGIGEFNAPITDFYNGENMKEFIDGANRKWLLNIKIGSLKAVKDNTNIDLSTFPECIKEFSDVFKLCQVLWILIKPQAEKANVSEQEFYDSLDGEIVDNAFELFMEEIVNFSPPQRRETLRKLIAKAKAHERTMHDILDKKIDTLDLNEIIPKELGNS